MKRAGMTAVKPTTQRDHANASAFFSESLSLIAIAAVLTDGKIRYEYADRLRALCECAYRWKDQMHYIYVAAVLKLPN